MPEFDSPLRSLLQILYFVFIIFLLFSKIISILSKKFHIFELNFLLDDAHGSRIFYFLFFSSMTYNKRRYEGYICLIKKFTIQVHIFKMKR